MIALTCKDWCHSIMSSRTMRHGATIFAKWRASLLAKLYFGVKALTLHFKGQQTYANKFCSRMYTIACQYTALLWTELPSYPCKVNFTLVMCERLLANAKKTVFWIIQFWGNSRSNASLVLVMQFILRPLTECNHSKLVSLNFHWLSF